MKWFKHMADTSRDSFVIRLEAQFGLEGYARWMKLIERIALEYEGAGADLALPVAEWCSFLKCKPKVLLLFLVHLQNENKIKMEQNGNVLKIEYPNIAKIQDDYRKKSGHTPERLPKKSPLEVEGEGEERGVEDNACAREPEQVSPPGQPEKTIDELVEQVRIDLGTALMYDIGWASPSSGNPAAVKTTVRAQLEKAGRNVADVVARLKEGADFRLTSEESKACSYVSEAISGLAAKRQHERTNGGAAATVPKAAPKAAGGRVVTSIDEVLGG